LHSDPDVIACVGSGVGSNVGASVGDGVGSGVGSNVGVSVGDGVGLGVGCGVGAGVGRCVGDGVGFGVRLLRVGAGGGGGPFRIIALSKLVDSISSPPNCCTIDAELSQDAWYQLRFSSESNMKRSRACLHSVLVLTSSQIIVRSSSVGGTLQLL